MTRAEGGLGGGGVALIVGLLVASPGGHAGCGSKLRGDDAGETGDTDGVTDLAPFEAGPLCGQMGPTRIFALDPEKDVYAVVQLGERFYVSTYSTVYGAGPCGEAPVVVGSGTGLGIHGGVFAFPPWPEAPLACSDQAIVSLDPSGEAVPEVILLPGCSLFTDSQPVAGGVIRQEFGEFTVDRFMSYHPFADGPTPELLPEVAIDAFSETLGKAVVRDDEVLFIPPVGPSGSGALTRVALPSLATEELWSDVTNFAATADHLLYFWAYESSPVSARVRERSELGYDYGLEFGVEAWEGHLVDYESYNIQLDERAAVLPLPDPKDGAWVVDLANRKEVFVEGDRQLVRQVADGRWFAENELGEGVLIDLGTDVEVLVADDYGTWPSWVGEDALLQLKGASQALWRTAYDGSPPELLAERASEDFVLLRDGRVLTTIEVDGDGIGALVVVDSATLEERLIDPAVRGFAWGLSRPEPVEPGVLVYEVADGERSGVYRINLAAS